MNNDLENEMKIVLKDLWKTRNITFTSKNTGIHYSTIYNWISKGKSSKEDPYFSFYKEYEAIMDKYAIKKTNKKKSNKIKKTRNKPKKYNHDIKNEYNEELLSKYYELYVKGLLTTEEFDKKKKELIPTNTKFNNGYEEIDLITVSKRNFSVAVSCEIGEQISVKPAGRKNNSVLFEIIEIDNPDDIYFNNRYAPALKLNSVNFNMLKNLGTNSLIRIEHNGLHGGVILRKI